MSLRKNVLHKYIDRIETTQTYVNLINRNLLQYVNRIGKLRDSGDELVKLLSDYAQYGRNNNLLSANLAGFSKCMQVIEDERDSQIQRLNIGVLNELNQYSQNLKFIKNEISKAIEALEKDLSKSKKGSNTLLNRCCSKGALNEHENENPEDTNQATSSKTRTKSGALFSQLQQKLRNYEEEKTYTISSILKQFILIQVTFNSQSQRVFACAYKCLTNKFVEFDISNELFRLCKDLYYPNYKYIFRNLSPSWGSSSPSPPPTDTVSQPQTSKKASNMPKAPPAQPPPPPPPPASSGGTAPRSSGGQASSTTAPSISSLSQQTPSQLQLFEQMKKMQPKWQQPKATLNEPAAKLPPPSPNKLTRKQVSDSPKSSRSETITNTTELYLSEANKNVNNSSLNNLILSHDFSSSNNSVKLNKIQSYESLNTNNTQKQHRYQQQRQPQQQQQQQQPQQSQQQQQHQSTRQMMSNLKDSIKQNILNMMKRNTNRPSKSDLQKKATIHEYKFRVVDEDEPSSSEETVENGEYDSLSLKSIDSAQVRYINLKIDEWIQKNISNQQATIPSAPPASSSTQYSDITNTLTNTTSIARDSLPKFNHRSSTDTLVKEKKRANSEFHHYENVQSVLIDQNSASNLRDEDELMIRFNNLRGGTTTTASASAITTTTPQSYKTSSILDTYGSESTRALYVATDKQPYGSESNIARNAFHKPLSNNLLRIMTSSEQEDFLKSNQNKFNYRNTLSTVSSVGSTTARSNSTRSYSQTNRSSHETRL